MNKSELKKLSKIELEKLGRIKGVELDRRFNKKTLIEQLTGLFTKEPAVTTPVETAKPVKAETSKALKKRKSWREIYSLPPKS
tara:strand:- start:925 stop:1173 length:249 start_codon:yes stop_codon:yes gene_type:complete